MSTVSHVLNNTRNVAPETAQRVKAAVAEVGYAPNKLARSLKMASTGAIGLAVSTISNPYFADIVSEIEAQCARLGLMVFLADTHDDPCREIEVVRALHARRVDGIILAPSANPSESLDHVIRFNVPCVLVDRMADARFDQVGIDNAAAIATLVRHLLDAGHRRMAFIGGQTGFTTTEARAAAFCATLAAAGVSVDPTWSNARVQRPEDAVPVLDRLLRASEPPTALIAGNNLVTIGTKRALQARGLRVPHDMSLVGIDDFEWADCFEPQLTLVAQPCDELGRQAASLLVERIRDPDGPRRHVKLAAELKLRGSVGKPQ
jgi:LacI family transcriptional regulator